MVVSDNTNTIKTTFGFNFIFQQAFKQHDYTNKSKQKEALNLNGFSLIKPSYPNCVDCVVAYYLGSNCANTTQICVT